MIEIYVITFADVALENPQSTVFSDDGGSIGRSEENTMILLDAERLVSRVQARIFKAPNCFMVENLSATSIMFADDIELGKREQAVLNEGTEIRIGLYVLGVRILENKKQVTQIQPEQTTTRAHAATVTAAVTVPVAATGRPQGIPIDDPLSLFGSTSSINTNNPFADLISPPNATAPAEQAANFSGFEANVPELSKEIAYKKMPNTIPEDFNAFSLPSAVKRNPDNPLKDLGNNNTISLKGMYEINETTDKLVDHGVLRYDLNANDLHSDESTKVFSSMLNVDPMAMFDDVPSLLPGNNLEPQYTLPNHGSELKASFTKLQNKNLPANNKVIQDTSDFLSDINIVDARKISETKIADHPSLTTSTSPSTSITSTASTTSTASLGTKLDEPRLIPSLSEHEKGAEIITNTLLVAEPSTLFKNKIPAQPLPEATVKKDVERSAKQATVSDADISLNNDLLKAFLSGAGISGTPLVNQLDAALMTKLGQMLQICVSGAVDLIQARAATKREFRSEVTMIVTKGNNPLKFSPDGQAAMLQLLGKPFPGFIPAVPALQDTFDDLRAHEVGMIVGTRAALHEVLNRFSPDELEKRLTTPTLMQTILPSQRKAHLWRMYTELFQKIFDEAENDFQTLYGKAFRDAYEDEVERLKSKIKE
jgi:FHA domain-containing protein